MLWWGTWLRICCKITPVALTVTFTTWLTRFLNSTHFPFQQWTPGRTTLWKVSANKDKFFNMTVLWRDSPNCELVFVDTGQLLTADFLKLMHLQGLLGQSLFYAIKLESTNLLLEMNITEIYDFSHVVFLVDKVMVFCISFPFNLRKKVAWNLGSGQRHATDATF